MTDKNDNVVMGAAEEAVKKKGHNIFPKIASVLIAFVLWFYVMTVESPVNKETFRGIPIEVTLPVESELTLYSGFNAVVDVTVSGKKSELNQLSAEDFKATADASVYTQAGKYSIPVDITVPSGVTVVDKSISVLSAHLDVKATATVPVQVKLTEYVLDEGLELGGEGDMTKSVSEILLSGPKSVLDTIETARVTIPCGNISTSIRASGNIELLDSYGSVVTNPYVTADVYSVDVRIPVFATKEIDLKVNFLNKLLNSSNCAVTLTPSTVRVRGTADALNSLEQYIIYTIDERTLTSEKLSVPLTLPEGVSSVDGIETVDVQIQHKGTSTRTFSIGDIKVTNPDDLSYEMSGSDISLTLRGDSELIEELTEDDIALSVDLDGQSEGAGTITLPINVKLSGTYSKSVYAIGEYNILVTIK